MKKSIKTALLSGLVIFLAACGASDNGEQESAEQQEAQQAAQSDGDYMIVENVSQDYYRPVITGEGTYQTSENRGVTLALNSNINLKLFEEDLIRLSQEYFSTETHFFQEGQYLPANLASTWLERESEDNPEGLNPESSGSTDPEEREPNYLSSILEHDYYVQNENGDYQLAGISIGLAMNAVDYYPAYQYGPTLQQEIPRNDQLEKGREMADEIASRMREIEGVGDVPIVFGIYEQAPSDDLGGGVYLSRGISESGTAVSGWENLNEDRLIFPLEGGNTPEGNNYRNFQSEVENFFPNLSGMTGRAHYVNDVLNSLSIEIMTQFYGTGEMIAFAQYLNTAANNFLPQNTELTITVQSQNGIEAFLERGTNEEEFYVNVFN